MNSNLRLLLRTTVRYSNCSSKSNRKIVIEVPCQDFTHISSFHQIYTTARRALQNSISRSTSRTATMSIAASESTSTSSDSKNEESKTDHLTRTSNNTREADIHSMKVSQIENLSSTVKEVVLTAEESPDPFSFKAGQWVDVFIPGEKTVGGFSMCSSPQELSTAGTLRLAIKYSTHPPAHWMHKSCKVGDILTIRVGGDFYLSTDDLKSDSRILLIAGGVGINPLTSMIRFIQDGKIDGTINSTTRVHLLFSAKDTSEHLFKDLFESYRLSDKAFNATYFVTGKSSPEKDDASEIDTSLIPRRILMSDMVEATKWLQQSESENISKNIETYLCGPPSMIKSMTDIVQTLQLRKPHFEQWW